jgi:ankyrin repeat protein
MRNKLKKLSWMLAGVVGVGASTCPWARADVRRDDFRIDADLTEAASRGDSARVLSLLNKGAKVDGRDPQTTWTPLMWAARGGHVATIRVLAKRGANVNARSLGDTKTYFPLAQIQRRKPRAAAGAASGAAPEGAEDAGEISYFRTANRNVSPLLLASAGGWNLAVKELLKRGASVNARTSSGETALEAAAFKGYLPLVETLLKGKANPNLPNGRNETPLVVAIKEGHSPVVKLLLAHGADPNAQTSNGYSALVMAKYFGYKDIERLLKRAQASRPARSGAKSKVRTVTTPPRAGVRRNTSNGRAPGAPAAGGTGIIILN